MSTDIKDEQLVESEQLSACDIKKSPPKASPLQANNRFIGKRPKTCSVPLIETQISCDIRCLSPLQEIAVTDSVVQIEESERSNSQLRPLSNLDGRVSPFGRCATSYTLSDALHVTQSQRKDYALISGGPGIAEEGQDEEDLMLLPLEKRGQSPYPAFFIDNIGTRRLVLTREQRLNRLRKYSTMRSIFSTMSKRPSRTLFDNSSSVSSLPAPEFCSGRSSSSYRRVTPSPSRLLLTSSLSSDGYEGLPLANIIRWLRHHKKMGEGGSMTTNIILCNHHNNYSRLKGLSFLLQFGGY